MLGSSLGEKKADYDLEILRRASLPPSDLAGVCANIPEESFYSSELVGFNDFYGNAEQIKRFLNLPSHYPLKAAIQHGNQYGGAYWDEEIKARLPVSLAWGEHIHATWKKHTTKKIHKIGAPFFYTQSLFPEESITRERARLGKNLLVFPAHSMADSTVSFAMEPWLEKIRTNSKGFESVRICIYWKDYLLGKHKPYLEAGYECVSAGHLFDYNFLPRLRFLLEVCDATMSNRIGSFLGYSLFLGKPHKYIDQEMDITDAPGGSVCAEEAAWRSDPGVQKILTSFSTCEFNITQEQLAALEPYFGFSELKSKGELFAIVNEAEKSYQRNVAYFKSCAWRKKMATEGKISQRVKSMLRTAVKHVWHALPRSTREFIRGGGG